MSVGGAPPPVPGTGQESPIFTVRAGEAFLKHPYARSGCSPFPARHDAFHEFVEQGHRPRHLAFKLSATPQRDMDGLAKIVATGKFQRRLRRRAVEDLSGSADRCQGSWSAAPPVVPSETVTLHQLVRVLVF
jgi:hypothetical protein